MKLEFLDRFSKNTQIGDYIRIIPVGVGLFHAGGQKDGRWRERRTDRHDETNSHFLEFCEGA